MAKCFCCENQQIVFTGRFDKNNQNYHKTHSAAYVTGKKDTPLSMICSQTLSSEYDTLIRAAAKYTDSYASDVLYVINRIQNIFETALSLFYNSEAHPYAVEKGDTVILPVVCAFRRNGVDEQSDINNRLTNWEITPRGYCEDLDNYYRAIYLLQFTLTLETENTPGHQPILNIDTEFGRIH